MPALESRIYALIVEQAPPDRPQGAVPVARPRIVAVRASAARIWRSRTPFTADDPHASATMLMKADAKFPRPGRRERRSPAFHARRRHDVDAVARNFLTVGLPARRTRKTLVLWKHRPASARRRTPIRLCTQLSPPISARSAPHASIAGRGRLYRPGKGTMIGRRSAAREVAPGAESA